MTHERHKRRGARWVTRAAGRRIGHRVIKPISNRLGFDLLEKHYYSPVPDVAGLPASAWERVSDLRGLRFEPPAHLEFLERELAPYLTEFAPPQEPTGSPGDFYLNNHTYESVDTETLYAMLRCHKPRRIIELGSGSSSLVIAAALSRNKQELHACEYLIFDPFPDPDLHRPLVQVANTTRLAATEVPISTFETLADGDVLFVDTTHTVKTGSDVNYLVLDVLPVLQPGVLVHFHDIFIPWEYPRHWIERKERYWAEQYLLQAFLAFNDGYEILFASHAVARLFPDDLRRLIPSFRPGVSPGALWLRRSSQEPGG